VHRLVDFSQGLPANKESPAIPHGYLVGGANH